MIDEKKPVLPKKYKIIIVSIMGLFGFGVLLFSMGFDNPILVYFWEEDVRQQLLKADTAYMSPCNVLSSSEPCVQFKTDDGEVLKKIAVSFEYKPDSFDKQSGLVERVAIKLLADKQVEVSKNYIDHKVIVKWMH